MGTAKNTVKRRIFWWSAAYLGTMLAYLGAAAAATISQRRKQESDSQTSFSKPTRNSKTPTNFVPTMMQNQSQ